MAKRKKVGKAQTRARTRVRRATTARSAGAGARKATARARKATRARKTSGAKAGARPTSAAKARVARKSRPASTGAARAKSARSRVVSKVVAVKARPAASKKPPVQAKKAAQSAASVKTVKKAVVAAAGLGKPALAVAPRESKRKKAPDLNRERRRVQDDDAVVSPTPPSSLGLDRTASSARSGRQELRDRYDKYTETGPALTAGDIDGDWESAYSVGDEAPGGDNTTPDQNVVDDIGAAVGVAYDDNEELEGADRIEERDRHRWEFDPASSDDFDER